MPESYRPFTEKSSPQKIGSADPEDFKKVQFFKLFYQAARLPGIKIDYFVTTKKVTTEPDDVVTSLEGSGEPLVFTKGSPCSLVEIRSFWLNGTKNWIMRCVANLFPPP
jgi:hypothetical protein